MAIKPLSKARAAVETARSPSSQVHPTDAVTHLQALLRETPDDLYALLNLAAHYRRSGKVAASSLLYLRAAHVCEAAGLRPKARACLNQLLRFDPGNLEASSRLARWNTESVE